MLWVEKERWNQEDNKMWFVSEEEHWEWEVSRILEKREWQIGKEHLMLIRLKWLK